jgi:hypothetical protein
MEIGFDHHYEYKARTMAATPATAESHSTAGLSQRRSR